MIKKNSSDKEIEPEQINVFIRIRPMRNEHSKKSLKIFEKAVAFPEKEKRNPFYFDGVFD